MIKIAIFLNRVVLTHRGSSLTLWLSSVPPPESKRALVLSDLSLGPTNTSTLLAEIGRRYEPRIRCHRGHSCRRSELNADGLCPHCLGGLGLT